MKSRKRLPSLLPLRLRNEESFAARRVRLFFEPTRTVLVGAFVGSARPKDKPIVKPVKLAFELELGPDGVERDATLVVGVEYERSRPQLAGAIWLPDTAVAASCDAQPAVPSTAMVPLDKLPYTMSPAELAKLRRKQIQMSSGLVRKRKEFFLQMDIETDPELAELNTKPKAKAARLQQATRDVQPVLLDRVQRRGRFGLLTADLDDPLAKSAFRTALTQVMQYLEGLIKDFDIDRPGDAPPGLDATFEAFARGDLREVLHVKADDGTEVVYLLNGEPDSPNYFLLAELAILACRADPASPLWPRLLRVFVRTQEIYCLAYAPQGAAQQTWPDYTAKSFRGAGVPSDDVLKDLRQKYRTMSLEDLELQATTNAQNFFCW